ncbi:hypothetical protein ACFVYD_19635 [Streptomyces sp. NPDC058301]
MCGSARAARGRQQQFELGQVKWTGLTDDFGPMLDASAGDWL